MDWEYLADKFATNPNDTLFHYTDINGLIGIITKEELWATDHSYLNDRSEFECGINTFLCVASTNNFKNNMLFQDRYNYEDDFLCIIKNIKRNEGVYCCSFSTEKNYLGQWRGYCRNGGYSIGFRKEALINIADTCDANYYLCAYEEEIQHAIANQILDELLYFFTSTTDSYGYSKERFHTNLRAAIRFFATSIKNYHFRHEFEWRLVSRNIKNHEVRYRAKGNVLNVVPYIAFQVPRTAIEKIYVSPGNDQDQAVEALKRFVRSNGINPEIIPSDIPLR